MDLATSVRTALLVHDGELDDLRPLLDTLGVPSVDRLGSASSADADHSWDLVIATPTRMVDLPSDLKARSRICVAESNSRTLRAMLKRADVSSVIVRPVHAEALKQVLAQALYSGRENRRSIRRASGQSVRFRSGWRSERGILAEISQTGCQLRAPQELAIGCELTIHVPLRADSRKTLSVRGTVVRASLTDGPEEERHSIHVRFGGLSEKVALSLSEIVKQLAEGPPVSATRDTRAGAEGRTTTVSDASRGSSVEPEASALEVAERADASLVVTCSAEKELRSDPRLVYSARIIVLGEGTAQVLNAEDISAGGLRAETHPDAAVGGELQVAIPLPGQKQPLVVKARVVRNQDGLVLAFDKLSDDAHERLSRQLETLPEVDSSFSDDDEPARVIVPERK